MLRRRLGAALAWLGLHALIVLFASASASRLDAAAAAGAAGGAPWARVGGLLAATAVPAELRRDGLVVEELIGKGASGKVYRCQLREGEEKARKASVAVKVLNLEESDQVRAAFRRESSFLSRFQGRGFIRLVSKSTASTRRGELGMLVMELADMTLSELIKLRASGEVTEDLMLGLVIDILRALVRMEKEHCIHGDLSPENVLVVGDWRQGTCTAKLSDFGLAQCLSDQPKVAHRSMTGTQPYIAPEAFSKRLLSYQEMRKTEVWSAGVLFLEMLAGSLPSAWMTQSTWGFWRLSPQTNRYRLLEHVRRVKDRDLRQLLSSMLELSPRSRVTMSRALALALRAERRRRIRAEARSVQEAEASDYESDLDLMPGSPELYEEWQLN